jgi:hypothetical protein
MDRDSAIRPAVRSSNRRPISPALNRYDAAQRADLGAYWARPRVARIEAHDRSFASHPSAERCYKFGRLLLCHHRAGGPYRRRQPLLYRISGALALPIIMIRGQPGLASFRLVQPSGVLVDISEVVAGGQGVGWSWLWSWPRICS